MNRALVGYIVLAVASALALYLYAHDNAESLRAGLVGSCQRVNVLRAQSNISDLAVWRVLSAAAQRENELAKRGGPTAETHSESAKLTTRYAQHITITALTDCSRAVNDAQNYKTILASPVGDPLTGQENKIVRKIERQSENFAKRADLLQ